MKKRMRWVKGAVYELEIDDSRFAYGILLECPFIAFFDCFTLGRKTVAEVTKAPVAFTIGIFTKIITDCEWNRIGKSTIPEWIEQPPRFFIQDPISKELFVTYTGAERIPATLDEVDGMEKMAIWDTDHVISRLQENFKGRKSKIEIRMNRIL